MSRKPFDPLNIVPRGSTDDNHGQGLARTDLPEETAEGQALVWKHLPDILNKNGKNNMPVDDKSQALHTWII